MTTPYPAKPARKFAVTIFERTHSNTANFTENLIKVNSADLNSL